MHQNIRVTEEEIKEAYQNWSAKSFSGIIRQAH